MTHFRTNALLICLAATCTTANAQEQFYTDGKTINGWKQWPKYGLDETYHFAKLSPRDTFWQQQIAVRRYDQPDKIFFYDHLVTRTFKGYYDISEGRYYTLPDRFRRHRIRDIRPEWFQPLDDMPYLHNMFKKPCQNPIVKGTQKAVGAAELATPPDPLPLPVNTDQ